MYSANQVIKLAPHVGLGLKPRNPAIAEGLRKLGWGRTHSLGRHYCLAAERPDFWVRVLRPPAKTDMNHASFDLETPGVNDSRVLE